MSQTIDNRVVQLEFDNTDFETNAQESLTTLQKLKSSLNLEGAAKNLTALGAAAGKFTMGGIADAVEEVGNKFSYMKYMGLVALSNLVTGAMQAGKRFADAMIGPITSGGWNRAMNLEQANFMMKGLLKTDDAVAAVMKDVNESVDGTAYSLDAAAKVAAQFAASGVKAGENMLPALKAVAGTAAMTNSSFEEIGSIFTTVAGQGKLMTYQMRQLEFRGLNVAAVLGEQMGKTEAEIRDMVTKGTISFEMFSDAMTQAFGEHAKEANNTFTGAMSNVRAALARIGAEFATPFIHNAIPVLNSFRLAINATKATLTPFFESASSLMEVVSKKISKTIDGYTAFVKKHGDSIKGIFTDLINIAKNAYRIISSVIEPIKSAFDETFEGKTLAFFKKVSVAVLKFTENLKLSNDQIEAIKHIFSGFFSIFDTVWTVIKRTVEQLGFLSPVFVSIKDKLVSGLMSISDILLDVNQRVKESDFFNKIPGFFDKIRDTISQLPNFGEKIKGAFSKVKEVLTNAFDKNLVDPEGFHNNLDKIKAFFTKIWDTIIGFIKTIPQKFSGLITNLGNLGGAMVKLVEGIFKGLTNGIKGFLDSAVLRDLFKLSEHGLFAAMLNELRIFTRQIRELNIPGTLDSFIQNPIGSLSSFKINVSGLNAIPGILRQWTHAQIDTGYIKEIGKALLELGAALFLISTIDDKKLMESITVIGVFMGSLVAVIEFFHSRAKKLEDLSKMGGVAGMLGISDLAQTIMAMTAAMLAFSVALKIISTIDTGKLIASVLAVMAMMGGLVLALKTIIPIFTEMAKTMSLYTRSSKIIKTTIKDMSRMLISFGVSILILSAALVVLSHIPFTSLIKSLIAFAALLTGMVVAVRMLSKVDKEANMKSIGASLLMLSVGLIAVAAALKIMSTIDFLSMQVALLGFIGTLASMTIALEYLATHVLKSSSLVAAAGSIMMVAAAMLVVAAALKIMSTIEDATGPLVLLAGGLLAITGALDWLSKLNAAKLLAAGGAIAIAAVGLSLLSLSLLALSAIPIDKFTTTMLTFVGAVGMMALTLGVLAEVISPGKLLAASASLLITATAIAILASAMLALSLVPVASLSTLAGTLLLIGTAIAVLGIAWEPFLIGAGVMVAILGGMALGLLAIGTALNVAGAGIKSIGVGLIILSTAISALSSNIGDLKIIVDTLNKLEGVFALAFKLASMGVSLLIFGAGAAAAGAGMMLLGKGFDLISRFVVIFAESLMKAGLVIINSKEQIAAFVITLGILAAVAVVTVIPLLALGAALVVLGAGLNLVGSGLTLTAFGMNLFMMALANLAEFLKVAVPLIKEGLAKAFEFLKEKIRAAWEFIKNIDWEAVKEGLAKFGAWIKEKAAALWDWLKEQFPIWMAAIRDKLAEWFETLKGKLSEKWEELKSTIQQKWDEMKSKFDEWKTDIYKKGLNIIQGFIDGLMEKWRDIQAIPGKIKDIVLGGLDSDFDINSPSKETYWRGMMVGEGFNLGLEDSTAETGSIIDNLGNIVTGGIDGFIGAAKDKVTAFHFDWSKAADETTTSLSYMMTEFSNGRVPVNEFHDSIGKTWDRVKELTDELNRLSGEYHSGRMSSEEYKAATANLEQQIYDLIGDVSTLKEALASIDSQMKLTKSKQDDLTLAYRSGKIPLHEYTVQYNRYQEVLDTCTEAQINLGGATKETGEKAEKTADGMERLAGSTGKAGKASKDATQEMQEGLQKTLESQLNIFDKFEAKAAMSKEELLSNMKSQIDGMASWAANMDKLSTMGIDQGLYQKLAEMGPQGAQYVGAFVNMTSEEMARANEMWAQSLVLPKDVAGKLTNNFAQMGQGTVEGFVSGVKENSDQVVTTMDEMGAEAKQGFHDSPMDFGSPSHAMIQFGFWVDVGLAQGILQNMGHVNNALHTLASVAVSTARNALAPDVFKPIGAGIVEGIQQGIDEQKGSLMATLEDIGKKAEETLSKVLKVNSPSKVMIPIGSAITEGLAVGVEKGYPFLDSSLNTVADKTIESMKYTIATIASTIQDGIEDPVITPVLDLSKVQAGVRTINSSFSASQALGAQSALASLQNGEYVGNGNVIFNQNNYSPKALSRIEIYRDTRNLFAQAKGALS